MPAHAAPTVTKGMFGDRYCEYLAVHGTAPDLFADVWNTYKLNRCPQPQWDALTGQQVAQELGALGVVKNGPRYWLIDRNEIEIDPALGNRRTFSNGLEMRRVASIKIGAVPDQTPYRENTVVRDNTWTWSKRYPVHELIAPNGKRYVMQAYSQIVDPRLSLAQLKKLGSRLELPDGWRYRTRKIKKNLALYSKGRAVVLQDELQNTYQLVR